MKVLIVIWVYAVSAWAAETAAPNKAGIGKLVEKFTKPDGKLCEIVVVTPLDYTTLNLGGVASETIVATLKKYENTLPIRTIDENIASLNLEEFRKIVTKHHADVVIVTVLKPTNFDIFLYDRRNPYQIYVNSTVLPESVQYQISKPVVEEFSRTITRRTLYAFLQNQSFDLPREESPSLLTSEIPRWIASQQTYALVNNEILSSYYAAASVGGAFAMGGNQNWTSNMVGLQFARRVTGNVYGEFALDMFAYNSLMLGVKYFSPSKDSPFRYSVGFGFAKISAGHTLNFDQNFSQGAGGTYVVPNASFLFPIVGLHLKVESRLYLGSGGAIFSLQPGFFMMF